MRPSQASPEPSVSGFFPKISATMGANVFAKSTFLIKPARKRRIPVAKRCTERLLERVGRGEATDGRILFFEASLEQKPAREAVNALASRAGKYAGIFIGNDREGYRFIIGSLHADAREAANLLKQAFNARGGGQPAMVQGSVKAAEAQIRSLLSTVHT